MKVYYRGLFKIREIEVVAKEKYCDTFYSYPTFYYKYLIKFPNGKLKYVRDSKLIFE